MLNFQRRRTSTDSHHLQSILSDNQYLFCRLQLHRKNLNPLSGRIVFQKNDTVGSDCAGCGVMFRRIERAERLVCFHRRAENEFQHAACLIVESFERSATVTESFEIGVCKHIAVITLLSLGRESVCPSSVFKVQPVSGSLIGVVRSSPVADDSPVKCPLPFQDTVEKVFVVAEMLTFVEIVGSHH